MISVQWRNKVLVALASLGCAMRRGGGAPIKCSIKAEKILGGGGVKKALEASKSL